MLFGSSRKPEPQTELIEILACNSFQNFDAQDARGWTALHRAAAFGTLDDVKALLLMKASIDVRTHNLQWTPLFCAVCFSNLETAQELWTCYNDPSQMKDLRGWNLLHVAAAAGNFEAVPFLLKKGVDLNGVSQATSRFVPASLANLSVKPSYIARNCGEESYGAWCEVLRSEGYEPDVSPSTIDWTQEEYGEKFGGCEYCETWGF
jgi:ankyrin repeat protein